MIHSLTHYPSTNYLKGGFVVLSLMRSLHLLALYGRQIMSQRMEFPLRFLLIFFLLLSFFSCSEGGGNGSGGGGALLSSNADLAALKLSNRSLSPAFDAEITDYLAEAGFLLPSVTVTPTVADLTATVTVNGTATSSGTASLPIALAEGANTILVDVTAEDGSVKHYEVMLTRQGVAGFAQEAYIKASNPNFNSQFGYSISLSGDTLAVAAPSEGDGLHSETGAVYLFVRREGVWTQQAVLQNSNSESGDRFGSSVSLSGDTLAVGATGEDSAATGVGGDQTDNNAPGSGAVYLFTRSGEIWSQRAYLKGSNAESGDQFGHSVSLSGDTLAVGAIGENSVATGVNGDQTDNSLSTAGAVYIFVRSNETWSQAAYLKASNTRFDAQFGHSVSLFKDTLAIGAIGERSAATGVNGNQTDSSLAEAGAVYVFVRNAGIWTQEAYIKASNTEFGDRFGQSVSLSDDTLAVGAIGENSASTGVNGDQTDNSLSMAGAVYVFIRSDNAWFQQAYLKASNPVFGGQFGYSVSLFSDILAVGAIGEKSAATGINGDQSDTGLADAGAVYVFIRSNGSWHQQAYVKASNTGFGDHFGHSVALSSDILAAGAIWENSHASGINGDQSDGPSPTGAAYAFE